MFLVIFLVLVNSHSFNRIIFDVEFFYRLSYSFTTSNNRLGEKRLLFSEDLGCLRHQAASVFIMADFWSKGNYCERDLRFEFVFGRFLCYYFISSRS